MSRLHRKHRRPGGFALIVALGLLFIVGATLAVLAAMFSGEVQRTSSKQTETQLRQLLIAGETIAQAHLDNRAVTQPANVDLPPALARDGATLSITGNPHRTRIKAQLDGRRAAEIVSFTKREIGWTISNVQLEM
jgi:type II secretory pathway component PulK